MLTLTNFQEKKDCIRSWKTLAFSVSAERHVSSRQRQRVYLRSWALFLKKQRPKCGLDVCCVVMVTPATGTSVESLQRTVKQNKTKMVRNVKFRGDALDHGSSGGARDTRWRHSLASLGYSGPHVTQHVCLTLTLVPMSQEKQDHSAQFPQRRLSTSLAPPSPPPLIH